MNAMEHTHSVDCLSGDYCPAVIHDEIMISSPGDEILIDISRKMMGLDELRAYGEVPVDESLSDRWSL